MKRIIPALLALLLFAGCSGLYQTEYLVQSEHNAPYAVKETSAPEEKETKPPIPTASDYYGMRNILLTYVSEGVEHGQFFLRDYDGDVEQDLRQVVRFLTTQDPVSAYATDYISWERTEYGQGWLVTVNAVYRRSVSEIEAIIPVRGSDAAVRRMLEALTQQQGSITLQISGYTKTDFVAKLNEYCLLHPDEIVVTPEISVAVYPDSGNVRVVEIHFVYDSDRETIRGMRSEADAVFTSCYNYIRYAKTDYEKLELLYTYLTSRFDYVEDEDASVYSLLCQGVGNSRCMASVVRYFCEKVGISCYIVEGRKYGSPYVWNILEVDGQYYHVDFQQDALDGNPPVLRLDRDMIRYLWRLSQYPSCTPPEPTPEETEETVDTTEESEQETAETADTEATETEPAGP